MDLHKPRGVNCHKKTWRTVRQSVVKRTEQMDCQAVTNCHPTVTNY